MEPSSAKPGPNPGARSGEQVEMEVAPERRPKHIAVIMDGNGRWAERQSLPRGAGHQQGAKVVRKITESCGKLGVEQLTLYCLSSENWKRPQDELDLLMHMLQTYLIQERDTLMENNIRLEIIGRRERLPADVQFEMDKTLDLTSKNTGSCLCLAINYGARGEIVDAIKKISAKVRDRELICENIDEECVTQHLYTAGMSDPDLLIRTAGEMRISNYLLWQISYSEIWVTQKTWPEFTEQDFKQAINDYASRERRFGGLVK